MLQPASPHPPTQTLHREHDLLPLVVALAVLGPLALIGALALFAAIAG